MEVFIVIVRQWATPCGVPGSKYLQYVIVWSYLVRMNLVLANAETIANKMFAERRGNTTKNKTTLNRISIMLPTIVCE